MNLFLSGAWTERFHRALNKSEYHLWVLAYEAEEAGSLCLQTTAGEDDGGFPQLARILYSLADMAYDLEGRPDCEWR